MSFLFLLLLLLLSAPTCAQNNNGSNTNSISPQEKDVLTTTPVCSAQALLDADISGNQFISRAEYVNFLLDLAPSDCPIIDAWLNEEPLQRVFDELSCLCHQYDGVDGQDNCCLQAVGLPMMAAFAAPDSLYPDEYAAQACAMIDQVIAQQCVSDDATDSGNSESKQTAAPTEAPTSSPTSTLFTAFPTAFPSDAPSMVPTLLPTVLPTLLPTVLPTLAVTEEGTQAGETVDVGIQDGLDVEEEEATSNGNNEDLDDVEVDIETTQDDIKDDDEASSTTAEDGDNQHDTSAEDLEKSADPPPISLSDEEEQPAVVDTSSSETPVGVILAALLVVALSLTLVGLALWGKRRQLFTRNNLDKNNHKSSDSNLSYTKDDSDDDADPDYMANDLPTPIRSNTRSHSFSSDDGNSSTDEDEEEDIERPRRAFPFGSGAAGRMKEGVVRIEFQDDLSVWGRRKRRKSERKQRREERRRDSMEREVAPERKSNMGSILSTLELDLGGGSVATAPTMGQQPSSSKSLLGSASAAISSPTRTLALDIFDDASETSSYDGSSQKAHDDLPQETSIEAWLSSNDTVAASDDRSVSSKLSVASSKLSTTSFSKQQGMSIASPKKKPPIQRQPKDPVLQEWNAQRHQQPHASTQKLGFGSFQVADAVPAACVAPSRSLSPARDVQHASAISGTPAFAPSASPKPHASHSVPASPSNKARVLQDATLSLHARSHSDTSFQQQANGETKDADTPPYELKSMSVSLNNEGSSSCSSTPQGQKTNPLHLDLPVELSHHTVLPPPRLSPASQEFYDSVLQMEQTEEDDSRGNSFAFEAAKSRETVAPPERYLV